MDSRLAIWFLPDDIALDNNKTPLMLESVMFCPILSWTCAELRAMGVGRLFVVADRRAHDLIRPLVPWDAVLVDGEYHARELLEQLKGKEGEVVVLNGAVLPVGVFSGGAVCL